MNKGHVLMSVAAISASVAVHKVSGKSIFAPIGKEIHHMALDERDYFERESIKQFNLLTPEERQILEQRAVVQWKDLTPRQQRELEKDARREYDEMTPQEQAKTRAQAMADWRNMTPVEKNMLLDDLPQSHTTNSDPTN